MVMMMVYTVYLLHDVSGPRNLYRQPSVQPERLQLKGHGRLPTDFMPSRPPKWIVSCQSLTNVARMTPWQLGPDRQGVVVAGYGKSCSSKRQTRLCGCSASPVRPALARTSWSCCQKSQAIVSSCRIGKVAGRTLHGRCLCSLTSPVIRHCRQPSRFLINHPSSVPQAFSLINISPTWARGMP